MPNALELNDMLLNLTDNSLASLLRESYYAYPLVSALHILGISILIGNILLLDLRLLGFLRQQALTQLLPLLQRFAGIGLSITILSGILLFSVQPAQYLGNKAFLYKMCLLVIALLNIVVASKLSAWKMMLIEGATDLSLKICGLTSILLWLGILLAGRWIAFI